MAAAELAMCVTVLTSILLGATDFGRFAYTYIAVTNAARAGAYYGATTTYTSGNYSTWQSQVQQAAADEIGSISGFTKSNVTATAITQSGTSDWTASCTVPCTFTTLINWPGIPQTMTIQRNVQMRAVR
jgi:Flp pilus assembly protein TadG